MSFIRLIKEACVTLVPRIREPYRLLTPTRTTRLTTSSFHTGASSGDRTLHLVLTKDLPRHLGLRRHIWSPEVDSNHRNLPSEGKCLSPRAGRMHRR